MPMHNRFRVPRVAACCVFLVMGAFEPASAAERPRARDLGVVVGTLETGEHNAITDVAGVRVGHTTVIVGDDVRTGVTAIIPAPGNLYTQPVPARIHVGNGYGKLIGATQVNEFGQLETPILLTCTLCVWTAADALKEWSYRQPGMGEHTLNPVVGEINDAVVSDMWSAPLARAHVFAALDTAAGGPVAEGSVGGGTGAQTYRWKGGIGTSSRVLAERDGGYTVGVLVQSNLLAGAELRILGVPVGNELEKEARQATADASSPKALGKRDGSIIIVVATDAPLGSRALDRLAMRAMLGLARTGAIAENGSGDYVIAFSTSAAVRQPRDGDGPLPSPSLSAPAMDPVFAAVVDATEEAVYNALFRATTVDSARGRLVAIDPDAVVAVLDRYNVRERH
jgi:D-aminopeptidase